MLSVALGVPEEPDMGIFSSECEKCGVQVKKRAKFCSKCGHPGPKAWVKCGGCNKWLGVESEFCPHCKKPQHISERNLVANNQIQREPGIFLQRIDIDDIRSQVKDFLIIEHGTCAVFMENGKIKNLLKPGKHSITDGFLKAIFTLGATHIKSFFIVDSGDIVLPFSARGLRSQEDMKLDFYTEAIFRFNRDNGADLIENLLKERRQLKYEEFGEVLNMEALDAVKNLTNSTSIDALIKDAHTLAGFENTLSQRLKEVCSRNGMNLERVAAVDFYGEDYETLRDKAGDLEQKTREAVLNQRLKELAASEKMNDIKTDFDLKTYEEQLAHEYNINKDIQSFERQEIIDDLREKLQAKRNEFSRSEESKDHDHQIDLKSKTVDSEIDETRKWMEVRKDKEAVKLEADAARLEQYAQYSAEQLATMLPPDQVEQILKVRQLKMQEKAMEMHKDMTPEQILAMNITDSSDAAQAFSSQSKAKEEALDEKEQLMKENAAEMKDIMNKAIDANSEVAKAKSGNNSGPDINIVK